MGRPRNIIDFLRGKNTNFCMRHIKKGCLMDLLEQLKLKKDREKTMGKATFVEYLLLIFFFGKIWAKIRYGTYM